MNFRKNIIVFGLGEMGRKLVANCIAYDLAINIVAIADNNCVLHDYCKIPIILPEEICKYNYDEIWVSTIYFRQVFLQLERSGINRKMVHYVEPVLPILEERFRNSKECMTSGYEKELEYLGKHHLRMYCYPFYDEYLMADTRIFYDEDAHLYYGLYNGHRMYMERKLNTEEKARVYFNYVTMEQDIRSPHCYWNKESFAKQSGISVDIGAAEGIYGLKIIDQIEHLYLVEVDSDWIEALNYTYKPYKDKVTIINKYIGANDTEESATIDALFAGINVDYIKMDIEGAEMDALKGAQKVIAGGHVSMAVCVYHHKDDNKIITKWLNDKGYKTDNSEGVVVCHGEWELERDECGFRKAVLFAEI